MKRAALVVLFTALTTPAAPAFAQSQSQRAEQLFQDARKLLESDEYDPACEKLAESQKLDPAAGTLALLAYCHEMQGRTATAFTEYGEALRLAEARGDAERADSIERQRERLRPKLSSLKLRVDRPVEGLEILQNGQRVPSSEFNQAIFVDPGTISIEARAPGREPWSASVSVGANAARVEVDVPVLTPIETAAEGPGIGAPVWIAFGVGALGVVAGTYFGLHAKSLNDDSEEGCTNEDVCNQEGFDLRQDARQSARMSNVAFGIGVAGIATGIVLLVTRTGGEAKKTGTSFGIAPSPRGMWAGVEHAF